MPNKTPYVGAALICERVLVESDGVLTAVRIVDTFTLPPEPTLPPGMEGGIQFTILVMLKAGDVRGPSRLEINIRYPSGKREELSKPSIVLEGEDRGANIVAQTTFAIKEWGLHWFDLFWEGQALTSIPLRLVKGSTGRTSAAPTT
jgi:hypothetical protein